MSDFRIIGNPDPVVGKEEFYSVNTFLPSVLPFQNTASNNSFEQPVKWEIYILENGRWRKTKENDKTGKRISYTFLQKSLERKGIRILARRGEDVARLNITTHPAEKPKIESIELLDKNGQKPAKPLSYGQTLKARVHCLHMDKHKVSVTLWEDDAAGAGHNKANEKNIIQTLSGVVKNGKADVDFLLKPSFAKIANKSKDEGKIHEYYVTTDFNKDKIVSNNVDVNDLEAPVAPYKGKTTPQQPASAAPAKPKVPASNTSTTPKGEITNVHITDTAGRAIKGIFNEKQIRIYIDSKGLIGKEVHLKLYDHDNGSPNDLLIEEKFTISANIHARTISLDTIPRSLGGNFIEEGAQQELFADVEVIETKKNKESKIVKVDAKVFKQDQNEVVNAVMKFFEPSAEDKKGKKGECFCNKDFEEKDVRKLVKLLKGDETIWEGQALRGGRRAPCNISDKTFGTLTKSLNESFKRYQINTCIQKVHFLAQVCEETGTFASSEETRGQHLSSQSIYKGRGLLQLTGVRVDPDDNRSHYDKPGPYQDYADYRGNQEIVTKPEIVANNVDYCIDSAAWIWSINKKMTSNPQSQAIARWGRETLGKPLNELAVFGEKYFELISALLNGRGSDGMPNNYAKRQANYNLLKTFFFMYGKYHGDNTQAFQTKDIIIYHIYENGNIEKHIPKEIKDEYIDKYKYVYHDKSDNEHEICTVKFTTVQKWIVGSRENGGNGWERRVADGKTRYYQKGNGQAELIKVNLPINYNINGVVIKLGDNTDREYMNPKAFASMLGAIAECGYSDFKFNGSTSSDGTGAPSVTHVNGSSFDFRYLRKDKTGNSLNINTEPNLLDIERQEKFIDALIKFGYSKFYSYNIRINNRNFILKNSTHLADHDHHLHVRREGYNPNFKEVKES